MVGRPAGGPGGIGLLGGLQGSGVLAFFCCQQQPKEERVWLVLSEVQTAAGWLLCSGPAVGRNVTWKGRMEQAVQVMAAGKQGGRGRGQDTATSDLPPPATPHYWQLLPAPSSPSDG